VDPENAENVYSRGAIPGWMKQKMQDQGYDPSKKADRDAFKANYLRVKEG
jgi:DNA-binding protein H-NS